MGRTRRLNGRFLCVVVVLLTLKSMVTAPDPNLPWEVNGLAIDSPFVREGKLDIEAAGAYFEMVRK